MRGFPFVIILVLCVPLYFGGMASIALTDPDETFYAETAREMISHRSWLVPLIFEKPQFEKPPFLYWLLMLSFSAFGVTTFSARFVPAIFGTIGVLGSYLFLRRALGERIALSSSLILGTSLLYVAVARFLVTDMVFSVCVALSLYSFYLWYKSAREGWLILFGFFLALAVLTKGPLGMAFSFIAIILFLSFERDLRLLRARQFLFGRWWLVFLAVCVPWYAFSALGYGREFLWEFFVRDNLHRFLYVEHTHSRGGLFYPFVICIGLLPWTPHLLCLGGNFKEHKTDYLFFLSWALAVVLLAGLARSKLPGYILPLCAPLAALIGISLDALGERPRLASALGFLQILTGGGLSLPLGYLANNYPDIYMQASISLAILSLTFVIAGILMILGRSGHSLRVTISGFSLFVLVTMLTIPQKLEAAFTNRDLTAIVNEYQYAGKPVVSDKLYARGVYFYSRNPVVVMDVSKNPFWSAHPLPVLSKDDEVIEFFDDKAVVLCVLREEGVERLARLFARLREQRVIRHRGDRFVVISKILTKAHVRGQADF